MGADGGPMRADGSRPLWSLPLLHFAYFLHLLPPLGMHTRQRFPSSPTGSRYMSLVLETANYPWSAEVCSVAGAVLARGYSPRNTREDVGEVHFSVRNRPTPQGPSPFSSAAHRTMKDQRHGAQSTVRLYQPFLLRLSVQSLCLRRCRGNSGSCPSPKVTAYFTRGLRYAFAH